MAATGCGSALNGTMTAGVVYLRRPTTWPASWLTLVLYLIAGLLDGYVWFKKTPCWPLVGFGGGVVVECMMGKMMGKMMSLMICWMK